MGRFEGGFEGLRADLSADSTSEGGSRQVSLSSCSSWFRRLVSVVCLSLFDDGDHGDSFECFLTRVYAVILTNIS